jgi:nucleotide-binding universal stress UspA family protein
VRAETFLTVVAATLFTTLATIVIFVERFTDGVWIYGVLIPLLASGFGIVRRLRGDPTAAGERMGRLLASWHTGENPPLDVQSDNAMPGVAPIVEHLQDPSRHPLPIVPGVSLHPARGMIAGDRWRVSVPLDGSALAEHAIGYAAAFGRVVPLEVLLLHVSGTTDDAIALDYLALFAARLGPHVESVSMHVETGEVAATILDHAERFEVTLVVMSAHGHRGIRAAIAGSVTREVVASGRITVLAVD